MASAMRLSSNRSYMRTNQNACISYYMNNF